jgi:hypothetical protein
VVANTESLNTKMAGINNIDRIESILQIISIALIAIPFCSMAIFLFFPSIVPDEDYFSFFLAALYLFLPSGVLAFLVQILRIIRKRTINTFGLVILVLSIPTMCVGILAYMAIYIVTS